MLQYLSWLHSKHSKVIAILCRDSFFKSTRSRWCNHRYLLQKNRSKIGVLSFCSAVGLASRAFAAHLQTLLVYKILLMGAFLSFIFNFHFNINILPVQFWYSGAIFKSLNLRDPSIYYILLVEIGTFLFSKNKQCLHPWKSRDILGRNMVLRHLLFILK